MTNQNNTKRTSKQVTADELRKRAAQSEQQASLILRTATKLEKEGKGEQASAMKLQAADMLKLAADMRETANDMAPQVEVIEASGKEEEVAEEVTQLTIEEVEVPAVVAEAPEQEEEATEEVTETPEEEVEATVVVAEAPEQEEEATEEVTEIPEEEVESTVVVAETTEQEEEATEEVTETPGEEEETTTEVVETSEEEEEVTEEVTDNSEESAPAQEEETSKKDKKSVAIGILCGVLAVCLILMCALAAALAKGNESQLPEDSTINTPATDVPADSEQTAFVMSEFVNSVVNIAEQLTNDENIAANTSIFVENIGEDKLVELIEKHGEINVQRAIAEMLAFVPEVKMQQYVANNNLDYNPNYLADYNTKILEADEVYRTATGKNPNGVLMSLEGYDTYKAYEDAMKKLIADSGDTELLTWYTTTNDAYKVMKQQKKDTALAEEYKEEVKLELANSKGAINLLELQLEKEVSGEITVMDNVSMQYTEAYRQFVLYNYMFVIAK